MAADGRPGIAPRDHEWSIQMSYESYETPGAHPGETPSIPRMSIVMMKRILSALAAAIALAAVGLTIPPTALASVCQGNGTGCTMAGTYAENAVINSNYGGFEVVWAESVVASYPSGSIPVKWTAYVHYINESSSTLTLTCTGASLGSIRENLSGGSGDTNGYVAASSSQCSQNPSLVVNVPPGGTDTDWAVFGNVPWPGTSVSLTWGSIGTSPNIYPFGSGDTDWAGPGFCSGHFDQSTLYTYMGVSACGTAYSGPSSNMQGKIIYDNVTINSYGFQCEELAARYFWFETTLTPPANPVPGSGKMFVSDLHSNSPLYAVSGWTDNFSSSLTPGQIISMGDSNPNDPNDNGHVGVVTNVSVSNGNGAITIMDENASGTGQDTITVSGGKFTTTTAGSYALFEWTTNLPT
jgi:CHAP domain